MNKYEVFLKVVEAGSLSAAATQVGYTQSAISQMINSLENELSATLLLRTKKGVSLSEDGESYLPFIKNISNAYNELQTKIDKMNNLQGGTVKVGAFASVSANWLPTLIKMFKQKYPLVSFKLMQGSYHDIVEMLRYGAVDICFVTPETARDFQTADLHTDEMVAVLPQNHKLSNKATVSLKDFKDEPYIFLDEGKASEPLDYFTKAQITPNLQYHVFDDLTILNMVEQGLGVSILPKLVLERHYQNVTIKSISPKIYRTISVAYRNKKTMSLAGKYFLDFILSAFENTEYSELFPGK